MIDLINTGATFFSYLVLMIVSPSVTRADVWNISFLGGISSPTPGIAGSVEACHRLYRHGCAGVSYVVSHNERSDRDLMQDAHHLSGIWEHRIPIRDDYHLFFMQGALGATYVSLKRDGHSMEEVEAKVSWGPSFGGCVGVELPIADLMGVRFAVLARHPSVSNAITQVATIAGIRFGAEWLGFGE